MGLDRQDWRRRFFNLGEIRHGATRQTAVEH